MIQKGTVTKKTNERVLTNWNGGLVTSGAVLKGRFLSRLLTSDEEDFERVHPPLSQRTLWVQLLNWQCWFCPYMLHSVWLVWLLHLKSRNHASRRWPCRNFANVLMVLIKLEWLGYHVMKKDRHNCYINISRLTRDKNWTVFEEDMVKWTRSSAAAETARRFVSLNILLSHSSSLKVSRNDIVSRACKTAYQHFIQTMYVCRIVKKMAWS